MTVGAVAIGAGPIGGPEAEAAAAGTFPSLACEVAFTTAPGSATPAWSDVTPDLRRTATTRRRSRELGHFEAGSGGLVLNNRDRDYDPEHSAGPWYGSVLPLRRTRLRATYAGVTYPVLDGYVDSWDQAYDPPREATCEVSLSDGFKILASAALLTPWVTEVSADRPRAWYRLGDAVGATVAADSGPTGYDATVVGAPVFGYVSLVANDADTALDKSGGTGNLEGLVLPTGAFPPAASPGPAFTFEVLVRNSGGGDLLQSDDGNLRLYINPPTGAFRIRFNQDAAQEIGTSVGVGAATVRHLAVTYDPAASPRVHLYRDGVDVTGFYPSPEPSFSVSGPVAVGLDYFVATAESGYRGRMDEVVIHDSALSPARLAAHAAAALTAWTGDTSGERVGRLLDVVSWPTAERDVDTGRSTLAATALTQSALDHLRVVEDSEGGLLFMGRDGKVVFRDRHAILNQPSVATFGDGAGELRYADIGYDYDDQPIRNVVRRQREGGPVIEVRDAASAAAYFPRVDATSGLLNDNDTEVRDSAHHRLALQKDVMLRVTRLRVEPRRDPANLFPVVLGLELGDQITVRRRPQGVGSAIDQAVRVEGISHSVDASTKTWSTTLALSPLGTDTYLQLDRTSGPGLGSMRLAY